MAQQTDISKMETTETAVEWLKNKIIDHQEKFGIPPTEKGYMNLIEQAKQMEAEKTYETELFWFDRGILAAREYRINELKPVRN